MAKVLEKVAPDALNGFMMYINTRHPYQNLRQIGQGFTIYYWAYEQTNKQTDTKSKKYYYFIFIDT